MKKAIVWMAENHVAANLLMIMILLAGALAVSSTKIEIFPEVSMDQIQVQVVYPGASPDEIEEAVCLKIEEQISGLDGVSTITSVSNEGMGVVTVELELGQDIQEVKDKVKTEVDRITTFPESAEKPVIKEVLRRNQVISIALIGNASEHEMKELSEHVKTEILQFPEITQVEISGVRNYEISINVSEDQLRAYGLTFDMISAAVRRGSLDLPGGSINTEGGEILIRTKGQAYKKADYENIIILSRPDGHVLRVKDVASVVDGFEDSDLSSYFDGKAAAMLDVFRVADQSPIDIANRVKQYTAEKQLSLPEGIRIEYWLDQSRILNDRIDLLVRNGRAGLILVVIVLALFLDLRLALWVSSGIVISFLGSFITMDFLNVSINMISLFAFILVIGIVVDDAIVVGENVFTFREIGKKPQEAANRGVSQVMTPVVFSVMTTVAAFSPLLFVDGFMGKIMFVIPVIVISVLLFSLMESLIILPSHLAGVKTEVKFGFIKKVNHFTERIDARLDKFINGGYQNFLLKVLHNRYLTLTTSIAVLLVTFGLLAGGILKFAFFPDVEADNMIARLALPKGASIEQTRKVVEILENAAFQVEKEFNATQEEGSPSLFKHMYSVIGEQPMLKRGPGGNAGINPIQSNISEINIELIPSELRDVTTTAMVNRWRELVGEIPGVESLSFQSSIISSGADIAFELSALDFKTLNTAVEELKFKLSEYNGVREIRDDFEEGKYELKIKLKPSAAALGLTLADLARQARAAFYGEEALRIQRGKDEVKVMVRLPEKDRKSLTDVENLRIRAANGVEVPFMSVAEVSYGRGYSQIKRMDGRRIISVTADVDETIANANDINSNLYETVVPELQQKYRGLFFSVGGQQKEQNKAMASLKKGFILALFAIYALLAIPFRSYIQPIIVMLAIPFGFVGAIAGHLLLGFDVSIMSMFGIVALAGIVVNDSLVLVDFINTHRRNDQNLFESVVNACKKRFRPILLTSLTTFFGLLPIILERSTQAKFLIPMAISLGMGVMFATVICLLFVPASVLIVDDITHRFKRLRNKDLPELEHNSADYSYEVEG